MRNSFSHEIHLRKTEKDIRLFSTKKDAIHHGIGMQSVRRIVDKYHGEMDIDTEGKIFHVKMVLYMDE